MSNRMRMNGVVISNKMDKTVVVGVSRKEKHPKYKKYIRRDTKVHAHTDEEIEEGTQVIVEESRPISKLKRWKVVEIKNNGKQ